MKQNKKEELSLIKHKTEYWKTMKVHVSYSSAIKYTFSTY